MTIPAVRRQVLASVVALSPTGNAGCLGVIRDLTTKPTHWEFEATVREQPTREAPGVVELTLSNESTVRTEPLFGPLAPFSTLRSEPSGAGNRLVLLPVSGGGALTPRPSELVPAQSADRCWRLPGTFEVTGTSVRHRLEPGESIRRKYRIYSGPDNETDTCPTGTYGFENRVPKTQASVGLRYGVELQRVGTGRLTARATDVTVE